MFAELAFAAVALSAAPQEAPIIRCIDEPDAPGCRNSETYLVGQLPWTEGRGPDIDYPERAFDERIVGDATVECAVTPDRGVIQNCRIVAEAPAGYGFGRAVARNVQMRRLDPARWTGDTVRIRVGFRF